MRSSDDSPIMVFQGALIKQLSCFGRVYGLAGGRKPAPPLCVPPPARGSQRGTRRAAGATAVFHPENGTNLRFGMAALPPRGKQMLTRNARPGVLPRLKPAELSPSRLGSRLTLPNRKLVPFFAEKVALGRSGPTADGTERDAEGGGDNAHRAQGRTAPATEAASHGPRRYSNFPAATSS